MGQKLCVILLAWGVSGGIAASWAAPPAADYYQIATGATRGATITSNDDPDSGNGNCTLRDALEIVSAGLLPADSPVNRCQIALIGNPPASPVYVINLPRGSYTYTLISGPGNELRVQANTVFVVGDDPDTTIIQAHPTAAEDARNRVLGLFQATVELSNLTLRHGRCTVSSGAVIVSCAQNEFTAGGGVLVRASSTLTLDNARVNNNLGGNAGGGISVSLSSTLNMLNGSTVSNNAIQAGSTFISGGGISLRSADTQATIDASIVSGNTSGEFASAGGISNSGTLTIRNGSQVTGNTAGRNGGGIANNTGATLVIDDAVVAGNVSTGGSGGGIYSSGLNTTVTIRGGSQIGTMAQPNQANSQGAAAGRGGGVYNDFFSTTVVDGAMVRYNQANNGGGLANTADLDIMGNSTVANNTATFGGGGVFNAGANARLDVSNSEIHSNTLNLGFSNGGGILNQDQGLVTISNGSVIGGAGQGNMAGSGGGIASFGDNAEVTIDGSEISGNQSASGGGIRNDAGSTMEIRNGSMIGTADAPNQADSAGGGIFNSGDGSDLIIDASFVSHNTALFDGGGIFNEEDGRVTVRNGSGIDMNVTINAGGFESGGGGLFNEASGAAATISDSTVSGNVSASHGGGVFNGLSTFSDRTATLTIANSVLDGNSARFGGGGIRNKAFGTGTGATATVSVSNSTLTGNDGGNAGGAIANDAQPNGTATVSITGSTIGGSASGSLNQSELGGAISNFANGTTALASVSLTDSSVQGNVAEDGGGIANLTTFGGQANLALTNTQVQDNQATNGDGGGLYNLVDRGSADVSISDNSSLTGNSATVNGGALYSAAMAGTSTAMVGMDIVNADFSNNTAGQNGGAVFHGTATVSDEDSSLSLLGVTLGFNAAGEGGAIYHTGGTTQVNGSCFDSNGTAFFNTTATTQDARQNWWGAPDGPGDADGVSGASGSGDGVSAGVDFGVFKFIDPVDCFEVVLQSGFEGPPQ